MTGKPVPQPVFSRSFGHGPRRVLALHCTIAHSGAWRGLGSRMEDEATLIATDMLSHGRSPDWDGQGDFQDRMVEAVLPVLQEPMDVVGHSFGATVALRLAVEHPGLVRSLTMIEPVFFAVTRLDDPDLYRQHQEETAPVWAPLQAGDAALTARLFNRMWGDPSRHWADLPEASRAAMIRGVHIVPGCDAAQLGDRPGLLKPGGLDAVRMPTLILYGSESHPIIGSVCTGLARRIPGADVQVVQGAGHMLPITHPGPTAEHLRKLFARVPT